jgi:nicotinamide phosphoribosyltransferase
MKTNNLLLDTDSYKYSHWSAYPAELEYMQSYIEARDKDAEIRFFGLQTILQNWIDNPITIENVEEARKYAKLHFGRDDVFNYKGWKYIADKYNGGLPLKISAVPEGSVLKGGNILVKIETTDSKVAWLGSFMETQLMRLWYTTTVCTNSYQTRKMLEKYVDQTSEDTKRNLQFMLHDFGSRGTSSPEQAALGGLSHLVNFLGTDTTTAFGLADRVYDSEMPGFSIPALEHSTIISWGKDREVDCYSNFIKTMGRPGQPLAIVVDSYDVDNAIENIIGNTLKDQIVTSGIKLVVRLDSGDPVSGVTKALNQLDQIFGSTTNSKGYKVLDNIGVLHGDGLTREIISKILENTIKSSFCATNLVFGQGGALLQAVARDDFSFAMKPSLVKYKDGDVLSVCKTPKNQISKASKAGDLDLVNIYGEGFITIDRLTQKLPYPTCLQVVYLNGKLLIQDDFETIRKRA